MIHEFNRFNGDITDHFEEENFDSDDNDELYIPAAEDHEIIEPSIDFNDRADFGPIELYDGTCTAILYKLLVKNLPSINQAVFVPINIYEEFITEIQNQGISTVDEHTWDYNLYIGKKVYQMKLIWIQVPKRRFRIARHQTIKHAFSFLQPDFLSYMNKPFLNFDVITQVNLLLDYHRTQMRRHQNQIFNIFDLIAFKMAIDDIRYEYENCEFHKLIDRTLDTIIQSGIFTKNKKFNVKQYLSEQQIYHRMSNEIIDYLVYYSQDKIVALYWNDIETYPIKLSKITNVAEFLHDLCSLPQNTPKITINETDPSGKCAEVLYEIMTKVPRKINILFELDSEWIYSGGCSQNEINGEIADCDVTIFTKNSFNFIENFINWLKFVFGNLTKFIDLRILHFETIYPYIFKGFRVNLLEIASTEIDYKLIQKLKSCKHRTIIISNCRIVNDIEVRYEFFERQSSFNRNIFKCMDELNNVELIDLVFEDHTIGILFAYVASLMVEKNLTEFVFKNTPRFHPTVFNFSRFLRSRVDFALDFIQAYNGDVILDFYELVNDLKASDREEFDFYQ